MISIIRNLIHDPSSFWFGFLAGGLFLWVLTKLRKLLPAIHKFIKHRATSIKDYFSTGSENRLRNDIIRFSQRQHLASGMFSLDEIIVEPRLMVPPIQVSAENQTLPIDTVNLTIPYIPDWPELGATYHTPQISIFKALQNGANIAVVGNPGSGKTVALAYLTSQIARRDPRVGNLNTLLPAFIHAVDINYNPKDPQTAYDPSENTYAHPSEGLQTSDIDNVLRATIVEALSRQVSNFTQPRLSSLIQSALNGDRIILLIDGMDELPPERIYQIRNFIKSILILHPKIRIVAAVAFENMGMLPSLGFQVMAMAAWGDFEKTEFVHKWGKSWNKVLLIANQDNFSGEMSHHLHSWLTIHAVPSSPLEFTLKVWSAYSGDSLGSDCRSAIEAYVRRMTNNNNKIRVSIEQLALQMVVNMNFALRPHRGDTMPLSPTDLRDDLHSRDSSDTSTAEQQREKVPHPTGDLANTGLFQSHSDMRLRFICPIITGYLAGHALLTYTGLSKIQEQPAWIGKSLSLYFYSYLGDVSSIIQNLLKGDDFLRHEQLNIARWLTIPTNKKPWRTLVMRTLVTALHTEQETFSLAARILTAIALSGDPGVSILLRQMLHSDNTSLRQLAALASGVYADPQLVGDLSQLLADKQPSVVRSASLALVAIGNKQALEIVADALLHGSELMRRAAAEALANHPEEGHPALEDGSKIDDLRVRYSVIFGLMRIQQPWAIRIIERMQLEEKEWIVRNAAIQAIEEISLPDINIPKPLPDLTESPWLIEYASKQGISIAPGVPAYELVIEALKNGNEEEKLQALNYLSRFGNTKSIPVIFSWYFGGKGEIRDAAYHALWNLSSSGVSLPSPKQYGFG